MKILYVVNSPQAFLESRRPLAQAAVKHGFEPEVVCADSGKLKDALQDEFPVHHWAMDRGRLNPFSELGTTWALRNILVSARPQLLHAVAWKAIVHASLATRLAKVPAVVYTVAGLGYAFSSNRLRPRVVRTVLARAARLAGRHPNVRFIAQNPDDARLLVEAFGLREEQVTLIRSSGVDLGRFASSEPPSGMPIVLLPSRLLWSKGIGEFVEAAKEINGTNKAARFVLVGEPDQSNPDSVSVDQLKEWVSAGIVEWWGWRSDMPKVLAEASIVVLPSKYREGVPRVLLEAAACGRPVVTTDAPGCREAVREGLSGLVVPVGDSQALGNALGRLLADPQLRRRMGAAGRRLMQDEFSIESVITRILGVYEQLIEQNANANRPNVIE